MLTQLKSATKVVGAKQVKRAILQGRVVTVYVAQDASAHMVAPIHSLCAQQGVALQVVPTMAELGKACDIRVGAAVAAMVSAGT